MSRKNFLKPFAATVASLIISTQANATIAPQMADAVARFEQVAGATELASLTVANADASPESMQQHDSHSSHASHASHSSHSSSAY